MSIIHDALKKVQKGLMAKADETPVVPPTQTTPPAASSNLFATPPPVENLNPAEQPIEHLPPSKPPVGNQIKSVLALICAVAITALSIWYTYQQFRKDIPRVQRLAKKSFYKMIHKEEVPDFKSKAPQDLKSLAQLTINPTASTSNTAKSDLPVTLNVHGIMANASGNLVLINDQVYQEGDEVDGAKIVKINLNSITVNINGTEQTINVKN